MLSVVQKLIMHSDSETREEVVNSSDSYKNPRSASPLWTRRRRNFRCRRNALIVVWSLAVAYYSAVNAEVNESTSYPITNISDRVEQSGKLLTVFYGWGKSRRKLENWFISPLRAIS